MTRMIRKSVAITKTAAFDFTLIAASSGLVLAAIIIKLTS